MLPWRPLVTRSIGMKFRDDSRTARPKQVSNVAQYSGWIVGMMQHHRDQRCVHGKRCFQATSLRDWAAG